MSEREDKSGAGCVLLGAIGFLVPVLYVLGLGPAWWIANKYPATNDFLRTCYVPLGVLGELFPSFGRLLKWYMDLFV